MSWDVSPFVGSADFFLAIPLSMKSRKKSDMSALSERLKPAFELTWPKTFITLHNAHCPRPSLQGSSQFLSVDVARGACKRSDWRSVKERQGILRWFSLAGFLGNSTHPLAWFSRCQSSFGMNKACFSTLRIFIPHSWALNGSFLCSCQGNEKTFLSTEKQYEKEDHSYPSLTFLKWT